MLSPYYTCGGIFSLHRIDMLRPTRQCALSFIHRPVQMVFIASEGAP